MPAIDDFAALEGRFAEAREPTLLKGKAYYLLGMKREADALYERIHAEAPEPQKDEVALAIMNIFCPLDGVRALAWCDKVTRLFLREQSKVVFLWYLGRLEEAIETGRRAVALNPDFPQAHADLGFVLTKAGRYAEAIRALKRAIELRPKDPGIWSYYGLALWNSGRNVEAAEAFEESLGLQAVNAQVRTWLAVVLTNLGEIDRAEAEHRKAKEQNPLDLDGFFLRGRFYDNHARTPEALAEFERSLEVDPTFSWPHTAKGAILRREGKVDEAIAEFKAARTLIPAGSGHLPLAAIYEARGHFDEALEEHVAALRVHAGRSNGEAHAAVQSLLKKAVPLPAAGLEGLVAVLLAAQPADPDYPELYRTIGLAEKRLQRKPGTSRCLALLRDALEKRHDHDTALELVLGEVLLLHGEPREALAVLEPASRHPHAPGRLLTALEECRQALAPKVVTPASAVAAVTSREREVLVTKDAIWRYFLGKTEPSEPLRWTRADFDDSGWLEGKSGLGYGDGDDATPLSEMQGNTTTLYIRRKFSVPDSTRYERVALSLEVDDGAVAYLDGAEVARVRAGARGSVLPNDAVATSVVDNAQSSEFPLRLEPGEHVLAIQGLNASKESTDFSLIPSVAAELPRNSSRREEILLGADPALRTYLEGLLLLEDGKRREAAEKLAAAAGRFPADPIPHLKLASCLREAGDPGGAEAALLRAIEGGLDDREVWDLWAAVSLADLKMSPKEALAGIPKVATGHGEDVRWLLERLAHGDSLRIHCASEEYTAKDGRAWSRDRFFLSGFLPGEDSGNTYSFTLPIANTEDDALYQSHRWFPSIHINTHGYRFPLSPGNYEVTLHFAEFVHRKPGSRAFGAFIEGREVLQGYEPLKAGFATAEAKTFPATVEDGVLDLEFAPESDQPMVSAMEIRQLREK